MVGDDLRQVWLDVVKDVSDRTEDNVPGVFPVYRRVRGRVDERVSGAIGSPLERIVFGISTQPPGRGFPARRSLRERFMGSGLDE